jgi:tetratricopeptide (TPR) repeat protein
VRRVLSWKRLSIVLIVLLTISAATYGVHTVQIRRQSAVLKDRAAQLEKDPQRVEEAIALYEQYLKFKKTDEEAFSRYAALHLGQAKEDSKKTEDAVKATEAFLRQYPSHPEERRALIDLYLKLGRLTIAKQHISMLFSTPNANAENDPDLHDKAATCEMGLGEFAKAIEHLNTAIETKKAPPRIFERILGMLNSNKSFSDERYTVAKYLQILLDEEPYKSDVEARIVAARFMLLRGEIKNARKNITDALTLMPGGATSADVLIAAAELERAEIKGPETYEPQLKKMQGHLEKAFAAHPRDVRVGLLLSDVLRDLGDRTKAITILRTSAEALGDLNDQFTLVIDRLLDMGEQELSASLIARIAASDVDKGRIVKYFNGRMALLKGDWHQAQVLLNEVAPFLARVPEFHKKAMVGLSYCYEVYQNPDKQLECSVAALKDDSRFLPAMIGEAEALFRLGRVREALPRYKIIVSAYKLEAYRSRLARLELRAVLLQPPSSRNWEAFEESLGPPERRTAELHIMHAESLAARGQPDKATAILAEVVQKDPKNIPAWVALGRMQGQGRPDLALSRLDQAEKSAGDSVDLRLARALMLASRTKKPTPDEIRTLASGAGNFDKAEQGRLWRGLGETASRAAHAIPPADAGPMWGLAIECFQMAAGLDRNDLIARAVLVDVGLSAGRKDVIDAALAGIAEVEGPRGPIGSLGQVVVRLPDVRKKEDKAARAAEIRELRDLAGVAKAGRPGWSRVYVALARLDELEGLNDAALANYLEAIAKGEKEEFVIRRAVELHRDRKQDDQAAALLNSLHAEVPLPEDLERFRAIKDLLSRDIPKGERPTIERVAPADSRDWRILLLRGALLAAIGEDADAQKAFEKSVEFGPHVPETWGAMVAHLVRLGQTDRAKKAVSQAEAWLKTHPDQTDIAKAELILAQATSYELIGDIETAEARYREAARIGHAELNPNRQLVLFLQRSGRKMEADRLLGTLSDSPGQDLARWARRHLAITMTAFSDAYTHRATALRLIDQNLASGPKDQEDIKARAIVLTVDPVTRDEGQKTLREFSKWGELTPDEYFLLGRLYFDQGKVYDSVEYYEKAARPRAGLTSEHLSRLVQIYLGINKLDMARSTLERLKAFAPRTWEPIREEARVLRREAAIAEKSGDKERAAKLTEQAKTLILTFPGSQEESFIRSRTGPLLSELGYPAEVEKLYTRIMNESKEAASHLPLATFLINQKRSEEAIALARKFEARPGVSPATTGQILTSAVRVKPANGATAREVATWLDAELRKPHQAWEEISLLGSKAQLLDAMGQFDEAKYDEAIAVYEEAIRRVKTASEADVRRVGADYTLVNNMCMLLVLRRPNQADRAIQLMTERIGIRGPFPAFLDTRAVAYLIMGGKTEEAANDLKLALIQHERPDYLFHLAWAYDNTPDKRVLAGPQLEKARQLGLTLADLHPLEARKFNELYKSK